MDPKEINTGDVVRILDKTYALYRVKNETVKVVGFKKSEKFTVKEMWVLLNGPDDNAFLASPESLTIDIISTMKKCKDEKNK